MKVGLLLHVLTARHSSFHFAKIQRLLDLAKKINPFSVEFIIITILANIYCIYSLLY